MIFDEVSLGRINYAKDWRLRLGQLSNRLQYSRASHKGKKNKKKKIKGESLRELAEM